MDPAYRPSFVDPQIFPAMLSCCLAVSIHRPPFGSFRLTNPSMHTGEVLPCWGARTKKWSPL